MKVVGDIGEFKLIERLARLIPSSPNVVESIGDDCAVVRVFGRNLLVTCDMFIEDVHFRKSFYRAEDIGWKVAAGAISDIAAMGGTPLFCVVSLACPATTRVVYIEDMYKGMNSLMSRCGAVIIGGDTARNQSGLIVDLMVIGDAHGSNYKRRRGAQAGDLLAVTGNPGESAAGFHALDNGVDAPALAQAHLHSMPRVMEGQWLASNDAVRAMMDVSDGVFQDAGHLAKAGGLGINMFRDALPVSDALREYSESSGMDATRFLLGGGEDFELLFALNANSGDRILEDFHHEFQTPLTVIGEFTENWKGVRLDGEEVEIQGWDHFRT